MKGVYGILITAHELNRKTRAVVRETARYMEDALYSTEEDAQKRLEHKSNFHPDQYYVNSLNPGWLRQEYPNLNNPKNCYSMIAEIVNFNLLDEGEDYVRTVIENAERERGNSVYHHTEEDEL